MSEAKTVLHRIEASDDLLASALATGAMQTVNLHDGAIRVRTPFGAVDVSIDHERQMVAQGVEMGPCAVVRVLAAVPTTIAVSESMSSLWLHFENDVAEPNAGAAEALHAPPIRADYKLVDASDRFITILNHSESTRVVKDEAVAGLNGIHDGTDALVPSDPTRTSWLRTL